MTQSKRLEKEPLPFLADIQELQRRARDRIMQGAMTPSYEGDARTAIRVLNQALATEIVCTLRYKNHHFMARGLEARSVADEFLEHAREEEDHADRLARRITQLGGNPDFNPEGMLTRAHCRYHAGGSLVEMIREDLIAEQIAIETYREIIRYFAPHDPTSRRLIERILAKEEEHAEDLVTLLEDLHTSRRADVA